MLCSKGKKKNFDFWTRFCIKRNNIGYNIMATRRKVPRNFCFTLNNYEKATDDGVTRMAQIEWLRTRCDYIVYGKEVGEKGTPHLQGYAECKTQIWFDTFVKHCHDINIEKRFGSAKAAADYCKKGEQSHVEWKSLSINGPNYGKNAEVFEEGKCSMQGKRNDIETCTDMISEGFKMKDVAEDNPQAFVKFHRGLTAYKSLVTPPRSTPPEVIVRFGPTATGKSLMARQETSEAFVWKPQMDKWWDGYDGERDVILEEFRGQLPFEFLLDLLDRYECKVQVKGGMAQFVATKIVICSPCPPWEWYPRNAANERDSLSQLKRRISKIYEHQGRFALTSLQATPADSATSSATSSTLDDLVSNVVASEVVWGNNNTHTTENFEEGKGSPENFEEDEGSPIPWDYELPVEPVAEWVDKKGRRVREIRFPEN